MELPTGKGKKTNTEGGGLEGIAGSCFGPKDRHRERGEEKEIFIKLSDLNRGRPGMSHDHKHRKGKEFNNYV